MAALPGLGAPEGAIGPLMGRTGYTASKHALHGFFDSLRSELVADGVSVLVVCPAYTDTTLKQRALDSAGSVGSSIGLVSLRRRPAWRR